MKKTVDNPAGVVTPRNAYSQVVRVDIGDGALLYVAGQIAFNAEREFIGAGDLRAQAEQVFASLSTILASQGATFDNVVSVRTYLTDITRLQEYAAVLAEHVTDAPPASATVEVSRLFHPDALIETEVVAAV
ncbi:MAG TPA: RidA family protein [Stackebrandtia sp.]|uniref:RidA family protein n=1 Tax=Stackebrandtia sp. TaxID=2023065 RepID=UPI002D2A1EB7|nr:RidA family protein [Stackebrandtia sp.]HZE41544.1 RidA family protein [Stackebrandtia sp.]